MAQWITSISYYSPQYKKIVHSLTLNRLLNFTFQQGVNTRNEYKQLVTTASYSTGVKSKPHVHYVKTDQTPTKTVKKKKSTNVHTHTRARAYTHTQTQYNLCTEQGIFNHYGKSQPPIFFMNFLLDGSNMQNYFSIWSTEFWQCKYIQRTKNELNYLLAAYTELQK